MHKEIEAGVEVQSDHIVDGCEVCKLGLKHGGLIKDYEGDRRSSKYVIIANLIGIYTVGVCPSIPFVLAQCGWFGIFVIVFSGWITWYSSYFLVKSLYSVKGHRLYDFTALGTHFFGYWTGKIIRVFTHIIQILSVGALVISILDNLKILFSNTNLPQLIDSHFAVSAILVVLTIAIPGYFVKTVNDTAFICFINPLYVVMICIVCIVQCRPDYTSNPPVYNAIVPPTLADGFSLLLFAFNGILSFPHLERTMKEPKSWDLSSFFAMLLTCCAFFLIGIMGYWAYGNSAEINFFSNLPQSWVIPALTIIFILQVYENCMSSMIVVIDEERPKLTSLKVHAIVKELIRVVVYSIPYLIMWVSIVAIKRFNAFSNFTGSINGIYLSVIMPPVFYVLGYGLKSNLFTINGLSMILMVLFGLTIGNYCVYITIAQL